MTRFLALLALFFAAPLLAATSEAEQYFPGQEDPNPSNHSAAMERGTAHILAQFAEPTLCCSSTRHRRGYRFTWLRTFDHAVVIRIEERADSRWDLIVKVADGKAGFDFENIKLIQNETRVIEGVAAHSLLKKFDSSGQFWRTSTRIDDLGMDGATWLVEAQSNGRYHYVSRWSPESGLVREIGLLFLSIAGLHVERVY